MMIGLVGAAGAAPPVQAEGGRYVPRTERGQAAGQIIRQWSGYVQKVYGVSPQRWAAAMRDTFAEASLANMRAATTRKTYAGMMGTLLGQRTSDAKVITAMAKSGDDPEVIMALGSAAEDLVYTMVAPCRIMDTRVAVGRLSGGTARSIAVHGANFTAQGGAATDCGIPADPSAVAINVVAVTPDFSGFMTIYPSGTTRPNASSMNYVGGGIVANEVIAKTTLGQPSDISIFSQHGTDVVVDIVGYFMAPIATPLSCYSEVPPTDQRVTLNTTTREGVTTAPACDAGYTRTATSGNAIGDFNNLRTRIQTSNNIYWRYEGGTTTDVWTQSTCCRIPGR